MAGSSDSVQLLGLFVFWYAFNAGYNVYNAHLKIFAFPVTISTLQLLVGLVYAVPLWVLGIRKAPRLNMSDLIRLFPIAALNALGHSATVVAMFQKGGGSFAHVIKASEPVVSVLLGLLINGAVPKPLTALSLLPISYGVAYASTLGNLDVATMSRELTTVAAW
jgi:solute carrier family 35 protein E1